MTEIDGVDYGPLAQLIGEWQGAEGTDVAPEPDGTETNPYFETITFEAGGDVTNAEKQKLAIVPYVQIVKRKSNGEVFHHEMGYWLWDADAQTVIHSLTIPRAVSVLAGGTYNGETDAEGRVVLNVAAKMGDKDWGIIQSPFMRDNATTTEFRHTVSVGNGTLTYSETTMLDIYGKAFEHTDGNTLTRV
ncbi:heme-binding beta-barrel domain-containing protein [Pseudomonadota bacterium]